MLQFVGMSAKAFPAKSLPPAELKIVIVCEDLECGKYAKELQDQLLLSLRSRIKFVPEAWTFRALQHPELQDLARREITEADIILFSTRGDAEVPMPIRSWLEERFAQPDRPKALVALFGPEKVPDRAEATRHYLEDIASKGRLDFFAERQLFVNKT